MKRRKQRTPGPWEAVQIDGTRSTRIYSIRFEGRSQPFGAIFWGTRGDLTPLVERAVETMNRAHAGDLRVAVVEGAYSVVRVDWSEAGFRAGKGQALITTVSRKDPSFPK